MEVRMRFLSLILLVLLWAVPAMGQPTATGIWSKSANPAIARESQTQTVQQAGVRYYHLSGTVNSTMIDVGITATVCLVDPNLDGLSAARITFEKCSVSKDFLAGADANTCVPVLNKSLDGDYTAVPANDCFYDVVPDYYYVDVTVGPATSAYVSVKGAPK
jgi:hypothetical protein